MLMRSSIVTAAGGLMIATVAAAQAAECPAGFPAGPISMQVGYAAGGGTDTVARKFASQLEEMTGWTVVVENKPGAAGGVMATGLMARPADGRTIGAGTSTTLAITPYEKPDIKYTYEDFDYLGTGMLLNYALVAMEDKPYDTLEEFIAWAKENGRATVSVGSVSYEIAVRQIAQHFGVDLVPIPSGGSSSALKDALGGHVDATVQGTAHVPQIEAGKMVQLATLTSDRAVYAPDTKTLLESGMEFSMDGHIIFFLPKGTPEDIKTCLSDSLSEVTGSEQYTKFVSDLETTASNLGPDGVKEFLAEKSVFYKAELAK
ncbi:tripartite tricarboxylate transporter substrate binding protein [Roseibium sp. Sym1]|uniref:tripartite tricarboxylate transporter substrate binding protein n=1 Tax=Roseibium sp. Sym1 TaxID=3016006 RepID=UPI0022B4BE08|nr:tripartite tricarboxylate transporter substrate binding protein [Roseibium sp. Sym1]